MNAAVCRGAAPRTVIVIGGGVSGLAAGGLLARHGVKVTLLEANEKLGGCCATTAIGGYTFNDGAVYLTLPCLLDRVFDRLALDRHSILPVRKITANQQITLPDGTMVRIGDGVDIAVTKPGGSELRQDPVSEEELRSLLKKWLPALRFIADDLLTHPFSIARLLLHGWRHLPKLRGSVAAELNRSISNEAVRAALSSILLYNGLPPARTPAISMVGIATVFSDGLFLPEGGMGKIPEALSRALIDAGGEIRLSSPVRRIVVRNGGVVGVELSDHSVVEADAVISSASGMVTFSSLLRPEDVPIAIRRKVEGTPLSHKAFSLQLGLSEKIDAAGHYNAVVPPMEEQEKVFHPNVDGTIQWPVYFVPTVTMPELCEQGGSIIEMYPSIRQDLAADDWNAALEEETAARGIEALSSLHNIQIAARRMLSPRYYRDRLHLYRGAVYGVSPAADPRSLFPHKSCIPGLYLTGQSTYPGYGVCMAAMSGIFAAESLLSGIK
jgi:phytoene dehydrogenase-like protein